MIDRALEIPGWMSAFELRWLAEQAKTRRRIVEIGAWRGRSTRALGDSTSGVVWVVDDWSGAGWDYGEDLLNVRERFFENTRDLFAIGRVVSIETSSEIASRVLRDDHFDMIFIDGDHSYDAVKRDIKLWSPLLARGGLLCGHDYGNHPGVTRAVDELGDATRIDETSIWLGG